MPDRPHIPDPIVDGDERSGTTIAHVMVVDDQPIVREFLAGILGQQGYRVTMCSSGREALERARESAPNVLVTDLRMGEMDGEELMRRMRESHPAVVPIVVTGYGTVQHAVDLMRQGAFDVLTKPCPAQEILATVARALEHHHALQANADLRERLRTHEKLAMIGKLAAGVAHELNNPLDATLRCVRMAMDRIGGDAEAKEVLDLAHSGLLRMADIVKSLLTFSRNAALEQRREGLLHLVEEASTGVTLATGVDAPTFELAIDADLGDVQVPRGIHQVLTNVLRNAADATGPTGHVRITASRDADRLRIRVADDGPGIAPGVLQRVFEPFFTTKPPGRGTGLGLSISARVVEKLGGTISIECPQAGGTVVTIALPAPAAIAVSPESP